MSTPVAVDFRVELPSGGVLHLQSAEEVELWERSKERYGEDFIITKQNDLVGLGQLLQQQVLIYRCQVRINGMEPETRNGVPTGSYRQVELDAGEQSSYQRTLVEAQKEARAIEKALGIDKATRESGGTHTVDNYIKTLKRAAHIRGVHIAKRTLEYEKIVNELRVRLRLLYTADEEDRRYHNITPKTVLDWLRGECERLEELDKKFSKEKGAVFVGKL